MDGEARRKTEEKIVAPIDDQVEPRVREALTAVAKKDPERLQQAIGAFSDDEAIIKGIRLAAAVALFALHDAHDGRKPTDAELAEIAEDMEEDEDWTDVTSDEIKKFLTAAYDKVQLDQVLPMERVIVLAFVIAANLVASYRGDDEQWWDYLDRAEAVIEATPEP
jgi:hypothetical protein